MLNIGDTAPDFCLPGTDNRELCLAELKGKWIVLYFYPKDNTPGCTLEAVQFTQAADEFQKLNASIVGVSPDSTASHEKFTEKHDLKIHLLSDSEHNILKRYGVWQPKKLYGKEFFGVVRSTFLIDPDGKIAQIWRKVRVTGHVDAVKETLIELKKA
jgi:peroxiredoxin Q/BCP